MNLSRLFIRSYSQNLPYKKEVYFGSGSASLPPSLDGIKFFCEKSTKYNDNSNGISNSNSNNTQRHHRIVQSVYSLLHFKAPRKNNCITISV